MDKKNKMQSAHKAFGGRLEGWSIHDIFTDVAQIRGVIFDNPHGMWQDGELITTTAIEVFDLDEGTAETWNTVYDLGLPEGDFKIVVEKIKEYFEKNKSTE